MNERSFTLDHAMPTSAARKTKPPPGRKRARPPAPSAPSSRGQETRARLLDAAFDEFRRHGFHGTSMRQIAQAAGLAVGGIYNHFHGKEEIFAAVLDARHPYHAILPALAETRGDTLEAFLQDAGRRTQAAMSGLEDQLLPIVLIELVEFQGRHVKALVERLYPQVMAFAQRMAAQSGELRDVPLPVLVRTLIAMTIGHILAEMILKNTAPFRALHHNWYGSMLVIYLHGVLKPGADPAEA
jgi:AcrR family transcriptional regulator